jgi:acetyl esterase/lipase
MKNDLISKFSLLLAFAMTAAGCQVHLGARTESTAVDEAGSRYALGQEIRGIVYSEPDWPQMLRADLYLPQKHGPLPVVIVIHGGGWASRSRDDMTPISRDLAQRGYAVMNLDYRLAPKYTFPAQLDDLQQARSWLTANAERYQLDLNRVNAWGYSSGAHLAALLGGQEQQGSSTDPAQELPRLRAVVAGGIPADLRKYSNSPIVTRFMGGTRDAMPERYAEASPQYHVSADDPPVFLYHGKLDSLVEQDQPRDYYDALIAAGVDAELFMQSFRGHMTMFLFGGDAEARAMDFLDRKNAANLAIAAD